MLSVIHDNSLLCGPLPLPVSISHFSVYALASQSCLNLCSPMNCSPPGSSFMGFSRQEYWSGLSCPPPGHLPNPGIQPGSPTLQADSLPSEPPGKLASFSTHPQMGASLHTNKHGPQTSTINLASCSRYNFSGPTSDLLN